MNAPILLNHDSNHAIGKWENDVLTLVPGYEMTKAQLFDTFGNASIEILEMVSLGPIETFEQEQANLKIRKFRVRAWSFGPPAATKSTKEEIGAFVRKVQLHHVISDPFPEHSEYEQNKEFLTKLNFIDRFFVKKVVSTPQDISIWEAYQMGVESVYKRMDEMK